MSAWLVPVLSGVLGAVWASALAASDGLRRPVPAPGSADNLEAVWATALGASECFSRPGPGLLFAVSLALSMLTLVRATRVAPMGTAYAVWTGIGAVLTVAWAAGTGQEQLSWAKALFLVGIVACVVGLHAADRPPRERAR